jgi:ABC-2 type transport system ATP-binding protein
MDTALQSTGHVDPRPRTAPGVDVISTTGLTKVHGAVRALDGLDLRVPEHSIVGFLGPNGAGKTTAIKLLLGLSRPTSGTARVFGRDTATDSAAVRSRVGYLAQDPRFYTTLTARETLEFTARFFYRGPRRAIEDRVSETLALVGLTGKSDRPTKGFSGGERQRLGIAQAQVSHPDLLILDEPAAALDPIGRRDVLEVMGRLREHTTVFYSTHILDDVQRVSDRVVILDRGRKVADAATADLLDDSGAYHLTVRGDVAAAGEALRQRPWVTGVTVRAEQGEATLVVTVSDPGAAEAQLLRTVLEVRDLDVTSFGRRQYDLEEVFLRLVHPEETS